MNKCVFCSATNITISMNVSTTRGQQTIHICQVHEDEASPKKVRELVENQDKVLIDLEQKAKELGYKLVPLTQEIPQKTEAPKVEKSISKSVNKLKPTNVSTPSGNLPTGEQIESHRSYDTNAAPDIITHEEQVVNGRDGVPIAVPKKIVSEAGTTEINIVNTGGDSELQKRFKSIQKATAAARSKGEVDHALMSGGYMARECLFCKGTGTTLIDKRICPKCKGIGTIQ